MYIPTRAHAGYRVDILVTFLFLLIKNRFVIDGANQLDPALSNDTPGYLMENLTVVKLL